MKLISVFFLASASFVSAQEKSCDAIPLHLEVTRKDGKKEELDAGDQVACLSTPHEGGCIPFCPQGFTLNGGGPDEFNALTCFDGFWTGKPCCFKDERVGGAAKSDDDGFDLGHLGWIIPVALLLLLLLLLCCCKFCCAAETKKKELPRYVREKTASIKAPLKRPETPQESLPSIKPVKVEQPKPAPVAPVVRAAKPIEARPVPVATAAVRRRSSSPGLRENAVYTERNVVEQRPQVVREVQEFVPAPSARRSRPASPDKIIARTSVAADARGNFGQYTARGQQEIEGGLVREQGQALYGEREGLPSARLSRPDWQYGERGDERDFIRTGAGVDERFYRNEAGEIVNQAGQRVEV